MEGAHRDYGGRWTDDRYAIDFGVCGDADLGLEVVAAHSGFAKVVKNDPDYGWTVVIERSNNDLATRYAHLAARPLVRLGVHVTAGEVIGRIGYSGLGPSDRARAHLHFVAYGSRRPHAGRRIATVAGRNPCDGCEIDAPPDLTRGPVGPVTPPPPPPPPAQPVGPRISTDRCIGSAANGAANMPVSGSGFSAGAVITLRYASNASPSPVILSTVTADAAGNIPSGTFVPPPRLHQSSTQEQTFTITATDGLNPASVATTSLREVRIGYITDPAAGAPTRQALHTVRGFPVGKTIYLHFRHRDETKKNVSLGLASPPCGTVSRRMSLLPTRSQPGNWTVYVDEAPTFSANTTPQLKYTFTITRKP